jgi:Carbohydrate esterase, sialic acid-specific acetylesterase
MRRKETAFAALVALSAGAGCGVSDGGPEGVIDDGLPPTGDLTVGGETLPRDKLLVVLHIGHSNMAGRATGPQDLRPYFFDENPRLWTYHFEDPIQGRGPLRFRLAIEPTAADPFTPPGAAGPGMALLHSTLARAPDAMVVSIGRGHSGRDLGSCAAFQKGGLLYRSFMLPAQRLKGRVTFVGLFTMLGATELEQGRDPSRLSECLGQVASDVRDDLGEPALPLMVGDYEAGATGDYLPSLPGPAKVVASLEEVPAKIDKAALIPTEDLPMEDDHHFNMLGHKLWAERALTIVKDRGWAPWSTASP